MQEKKIFLSVTEWLRQLGNPDLESFHLSSSCSSSICEVIFCYKVNMFRFFTAFNFRCQKFIWLMLLALLYSGYIYSVSLFYPFSLSNLSIYLSIYHLYLSTMYSLYFYHLRHSCFWQLILCPVQTFTKCRSAATLVKFPLEEKKRTPKFELCPWHLC